MRQQRKHRWLRRQRNEQKFPFALSGWVSRIDWYWTISFMDLFTVLKEKLRLHRRGFFVRLSGSSRINCQLLIKTNPLWSGFINFLDFPRSRYNIVMSYNPNFQSMKDNNNYIFCYCEIRSSWKYDKSIWKSFQMKHIVETHFNCYQKCKSNIMKYLIPTISNECCCLHVLF